MTERTGYSGFQIGLHWLVAVLILANWFLGDMASEALRAGQTGFEGASGNLHVWIGIIVLVLVLIRLAVRILRGAPAAPGQPGSLAVRAAHWGHLALYALMIAVPLGGALVWYQGMKTMAEFHEIAGTVLFALALGHAAVALFHHYVLKDGLLKRMMRPE